MLLVLFSALGPLKLMPSAAAQLGPLPWRINCGDGNGFLPVQPGWQMLSETTAPAGITLAPGAVDTVRVAMVSTLTGLPLMPSDVYTIDPDQLDQTHLLTSLQLADDTQLTIGGLAANTTYRVRLELGALAPWLDIVPVLTWGPATISREVRVEELTPGTSQWRTLVQDVRCTTGYLGSSLASELGGIVPVWCRVHSDAAGVVKLRFSTDGADPVYLAGFEVHAWEALPVFYKHTAAGPLQSTVPALSGFVAAFNAHDYDLAQQTALAVVDPWQRGSALCHLIGWLDGSRDGRFHLVDEARSALVAAQGSHAGSAWLIDQLDQLQRALDHLAARGYGWARECPSEGGFGFLNEDCAGQVQLVGGVADTNVNAHIALRLLSGLCAPATGATVLADIKAWNGGSGGTAGWEPSPLVFAALKTYGTTLAAINPKFNVGADPESQELLTRFKDIFQYGFLDPAYDVGDFPKDVELRVFQRYAELGTHPYYWDDAEIASTLTDAQIDASWWGPEVTDLPDAPYAATWANLQRDVMAVYRNIVEYWLSERLQEGEVGGGIGDDVELLLALFPAYAGQQDQGSRRQLDALDTMARHFFETSVDDGYYAGLMTDVEHAAEVTTNVGHMLRGAFGNTRMALLNGFGVGQHLLYAANPAAAWAADTVLGRLHLKSFYFTTDGPDAEPLHAYDLPFNGRALMPPVAVAGHAPLASSHPLAADLRALADGWRDDALATSSGKPKGFFGPVAWPSNEFGKNGWWWSDVAAANTDIFTKTHVAYTLELLRVAYHTSAAADRWRYLLPAVRMFRAAQQWEDQGQPSASQGTVNWAAQQFRDGPRFHALVVSHLQDLEADPTLTSTDDPDLSGTAPYVDSALGQRLHDWAETGQGLFGVNHALAYAVSPVLPCGGTGVTIKDQANALQPYKTSLPYLRLAYPLVTKHVLHTDRVLMNRGQLMPYLMSSQTGGNLMEGVPQRPALRWVGRVGDPLDLTVFVNGKGWDETWVSAFVHNFGALPASLDLWLDEGLVPGRYRIEIGPTTPKCDTFGPGAVFSTSFVDKRGTGVAAPITLDPGTSLVRVVRDGAPTAPAGRWDLAVDPPELEIQKHDGVADLVLRARVANVGSDPSPPASLSFHGSLALPSGESLPFFVGEVQVGTLGVPGLAGSNGWQPAEAEFELHLPFTQIIADVLVAGLGIQLRADLAAGSGDWDQLNNSISRLWLPEEMPLITLFK